MSALRIALVSSEISPFAQTGGLGDMVASLGKALKSAGVEPVFFLPHYPSVSEHLSSRLLFSGEIRIGQRRLVTRLSEGEHPDFISTYLIDLPEMFHRRGLYGEHGADYPDNAARFIAFSRAVLECVREIGLACDVFHAND